MVDVVALWIGRLLLLVLGIGALAVAADWALVKVTKACGSYKIVVEWQLDRRRRRRGRLVKRTEEGAGDG